MYINNGKCDVRVQDFLRDRGFSGYIHVTTHSVAGAEDGVHAATRISRSAHAVPWTPRLLDWLHRAVHGLPGFVRADRVGEQGIVVTWRGVR